MSKCHIFPLGLIHRQNIATKIDEARCSVIYFVFTGWSTLQVYSIELKGTRRAYVCNR